MKRYENARLCRVVTPAQAVAIDKHMIQTLGIPGLVLMEQASMAVAHAVMRLAPRGSRVLCVCGKGNNGGDGWATARILLMHGYDVHVGAVSIELPPDAAQNQTLFERHTPRRYTLLNEQTLANFFAHPAAVVVDALFGTGLARPPQGLYAQIIREINAHPAAVVAVDIPSGVFGETGQCQDAVHADATVTFQYAKPGHYLFPGAAHCGKLTVQTIGLDDGAALPELYHLEEYERLARNRNANKGSFGKLCIVAGSRGMAGAAVLCARAAVASGAGLTAFGGPQYVADVLQGGVPEVMARGLGANADELEAEADELRAFADGTALAIGPGLGRGAGVLRAVRAALELPLPKVLDADALNALAGEPELLDAAKNTVLTPHPKEFSRLCSTPVQKILANPVHLAREFAHAHGVVLLLKGATTIVTDGAHTVLVTAGAPSMAKGGSGDVLTGVIGGLLAQGVECFEAAWAGAYLCGKAGERAAEAMGEYAPCASDTIRFL